MTTIQNDTIFTNGSQVFFVEKIYDNDNVKVAQIQFIMKKFAFPTMVDDLDKPIYRIIKRQPKHPRRQRFTWTSKKDTFYEITLDDYLKFIDADGSTCREEQERNKGGE